MVTGAAGPGKTRLALEVASRLEHDFRDGVVHAFAPHAAHCPPIDYARLNTLARQAGEVLGLDVYGGDCLVTPDGALCLIDINDWPSFRGCRPVAARHIAQHILTQAQQRGLL